jgi:hypothetical protein
MVSPELKLMQFIAEYADALREHIEKTSAQLEISTTQAMSVVHDFSGVAEQKKEESEAMMEQSYLSPADDILKMMNFSQKSADYVFEMAKSGSLESVEPLVNLRDSANDLRLMSGVFSKHMESMSRFDDDTRDVLLAIVGDLSNSDVNKQRLEHVCFGINAVSEKLKSMIDMITGEMTRSDVFAMKDSVLEQTYLQYTVEEEKVNFKLIFGPPPHIVRAYHRRTG